MSGELESGLAEPQKLALRLASRSAYRPTLALLALDGRLASVMQRRGEPALAQMRIAWWREMLASPVANWPEGEPLLRELAQWRDSAQLVDLADGWEQLLADQLDNDAIDAFVGGRSAAFAALAGELGVPGAPAATAAGNWALADLAANLSDPGERERVLARSADCRAVALPRALRPLAILSALGLRGLRRGGRPLLEGRGAGALAFRVGLVGR